MKKMFILLVALLAWHGTSAQSCFPEGITFSSQPQINNFRFAYPDCKQIDGDLIITGSNITSISGLSVLTLVGGSLMIECNPNLTSLAGLDNITFIGGDLHVEQNILLANLMGLGQVNHVGGNVIITTNVAMTSLVGLQGLTTIPGKLWIDYNENLINLAGLNNVVAVGDFMRISANRDLVSLGGLDNLMFTGGSVLIGGQDHLGGIGNPSMTNIAALSNLTSIGGSLEIAYNTSLLSLHGLDNLEAGSISDLAIYNNIYLSDCEVECVCDYLISPAGEAYIANNAPGCNSIDEVEAACVLTLADKTSTDRNVQVYPNPTYGLLTVEIPGNNSALTFRISNMAGKDCFTYGVTGPKFTVDLSRIPAGIYVVRLSNDRLTWVGKVVRN